MLGRTAHPGYNGDILEVIMAEVKEVGEVYKCEICGNVVEVKEAGGGELVCCGEPMKLIS
jgi:desulfoferrodoxin-like iron-binding protein